MSDIQRWAMPSVEGPIIGRRVSEAEQRSAERSNHARGDEEGLAAARVEL